MLFFLAPPLSIIRDQQGVVPDAGLEFIELFKQFLLLFCWVFRVVIVVDESKPLSDDGHK